MRHLRKCMASFNVPPSLAILFSASSLYSFCRQCLLVQIDLILSVIIASKSGHFSFFSAWIYDSRSLDDTFWIDAFLVMTMIEKKKKNRRAKYRTEIAIYVPEKTDRTQTILVYWPCYSKINSILRHWTHFEMRKRPNTQNEGNDFVVVRWCDIIRYCVTQNVQHYCHSYSTLFRSNLCGCVSHNGDRALIFNDADTISGPIDFG